MPATLPPAPPPPAKPRRWRWPLLLLILAALSGGGYYWWQQARNALPPGFVSANGRIEADEIDIETKFAGRIAALMADEGDLVKAGQVLARMDTASDQSAGCRAGRAVLGGEARILLDALPRRPIPAMVSFIASQAQFTPKTVETRSERDKLMFRVRVRVDKALLRAHAAEVRAGLPGVAYLRLDPAAA